MQTTTCPSVDEFIEAFVVALIDLGVMSIDPNAESTNKGISRVFCLLERLAASSTDAHERRWLMRVRNIIAPSNIGTYDYFLSALRSRQLGFVTSPNPRYSEISFRLSQPHARQFLKNLPLTVRLTAQSAAAAFSQEESEQTTEEVETRRGDGIKSDSRSPDRVAWKQ